MRAGPHRQDRIRRAQCRSRNRRTERGRLAGSTERRGGVVRPDPYIFAERVRRHRAQRGLRRHGHVTAAVMCERSARMLGGTFVELGRSLVMRKVRMRDQMHGCFRHLGHSRGDGEEQRNRDQKSHGLTAYFAAFGMSRQPTNATKTPVAVPRAAKRRAAARRRSGVSKISLERPPKRTGIARRLPFFWRPAQTRPVS